MSAKLMLSGLKWSALGRLLTQVISWALTLLIIRLLTPHDYGLIVMAQSVITIVSYITELGMGWSIVQKEKIEASELDSLNTFFVLLNVVLALILVAAAPAIGLYFAEDEVVGVLQALALTLVILALAVVPRSMLVRAMRFRPLAIIKAGAAIVGGAATLILALKGLGAWALVYGSIVGYAAETAGYIVAQRAPPRFGFRMGLLRPHMKFGVNILLQRMIWVTYARVDVFVLARVFDARIVGIYSVGQELSSLPLDRIGQILNQVVFAGFSRVQNDPRAVERYFLRGIRLGALLCFPAFLGISAIADPLVALVLGSKWIEAAIVIQLLALIVPLRLISMLSAEILNATGGSSVALRNIALTAVCVVAGILVGVQWGMVGLCIGWSVGYTVAFFALIVQFSAMTGIGASKIYAAIGRPLIACAVMYFCAYWVAAHGVNDSLWLTLSAAILAGVASYAIACLILCRDYWSDIEATIKTMRSKE